MVIFLTNAFVVGIASGIQYVLTVRVFDRLRAPPDQPTYLMHGTHRVLIKNTQLCGLA